MTKLAIDTGFGAELIVWPEVATSLGLSVEQPPPGFKPALGEVAIAHSSPANVVILGKTFSAVSLSVMEIPPYVSADVQGAVGWPAIRNGRIAFDAIGRKVVEAPRLPTAKEGWTKLGIRKDAPVLELVVGPAEWPELILVDTGSSDGVRLSPEKWRLWQDAHPRRRRSLIAYFTPLAGIVVREEAWADDLLIDGLRFRGVAVSEIPEGVRAGADKYAAIIGLKALERIDLVVDGPAGEAYLRSRRDVPQPYDHNRLGAVFVPRDEKSADLVCQIASGSPAARAGLHEGDVLLAVDQLDVRPWRTQPGILPLSRFWNQPVGTKQTLRVRRGTKELNITVTLVDLLGPRPIKRAP